MSEIATANPCLNQETLEKYLGGWLNELESSKVESHLAVCQACETKMQSVEEQAIVDRLLEPNQKATSHSPSTPDDGPAGQRFWDRNHPWQPALPSRHLGPYELLEPLGYGGMGYVYLAKHTRLDREVAIKILPAYCQTDFAKARFEREIAAIGRLQHPAIVAATDAGQTGDLMYLVMEYVRGSDLAKLCRLLPNWTVEDVCEIGRQVAMGLSYAHAAGMVHRDIKPSNLMLDASGTIKILDFGLVQLDRWDGAASELTTIGQFLGTLDYMAPEQAVQSGSVDYRADLYALGATMFRMLCGRGPLAVTPNQSPIEKLRLLSDHRPPSLVTLRPDAPSELVKIVDALLATKPVHRPASAAHVAESLAPLAQNSRLPELLNSVNLQQVRISSTSSSGSDASPNSQVNDSKSRLLLTNSRDSIGNANTWKWISAACSLPLVLFALYALTLDTSNGQLVIESEVPGIRIQLKKNGVVAKTIDVKTGNTVTKLSADRYDIELESPSDNIAIDHQSITIANQETVIARIREIDGTSPSTASRESGTLYGGKNLSQWLDTFHREKESKAWVESVTAIGILADQETKLALYPEVFEACLSRNSISYIYRWRLDELLVRQFVQALNKAEPTKQAKIASMIPTFNEAESLTPYWEWLEEQEKSGRNTTELLATGIRGDPNEIFYSQHARWFLFLDKHYPRVTQRLDWLCIWRGKRELPHTMVQNEAATAFQDYLISKSFSLLATSQNYGYRSGAFGFLQSRKKLLTDQQLALYENYKVQLITEALDHRLDVVDLETYPYNSTPFLNFTNNYGKGTLAVAYLFQSISADHWKQSGDKSEIDCLNALAKLEESTREDATSTWEELRLAQQRDVKFHTFTFEQLPVNREPISKRDCTRYVLYRYAAQMLYNQSRDNRSVRSTPNREDAIERTSPHELGEEIDEFKALDTDGNWLLSSNEAPIDSVGTLMNFRFLLQSKKSENAGGVDLPNKGRVYGSLLAFARARIKKLDKDKDGLLNREEFKEGDFALVDTNADGSIDAEEYAHFRASR